MDLVMNLYYKLILIFQKSLENVSNEKIIININKKVFFNGRFFFIFINYSVKKKNFPNYLQHFFYIFFTYLNIFTKM